MQYTASSPDSSPVDIWVVVDGIVAVEVVLEISGMLIVLVSVAVAVAVVVASLISVKDTDTDGKYTYIHTYVYTKRWLLWVLI